MNELASDRPAILGGEPAFPGGLRFVRPATPPLERVTARLAPSYDRGILTNGPLVRTLEDESAARLGTLHAVAVSSCTAGLMLVIRALVPKGRVVLPSFTFSASAHAVAWNNLAPVFAECDPLSFQLDVKDATARLEGADALLATHVFGAPCPAEQLEQLAAGMGVPVLFDAAHGFGATRAGRAVGSFGSAEVFSLSPTKVVVGGEGGIVTTDDGALADDIRMGRDYGNPGDYDTRFVGLSARMSELHAAMALESLADLDDHLRHRRRLARRYRAGLSAVPGLTPQAVAAGDESTFKDFTISIDPGTYGLTRDQVVAALQAEGIDVRRYFYPPVHRQRAYAVHGVDLPVTSATAERVLSLPIYAGLPEDALDRVVDVLARLRSHSAEVQAGAAG